MPAEAPADATEAVKTRARDARLRFKKRERNAKAMIILSIAEPQQVHIKACKTATEVWQTLEARFERRTAAEGIHLKAKWSGLRMQPGQSIEEYYEVAMALVDEMQLAGIDSPEHDQITQVMIGLTPEYIPLISSLNAIASTKLLAWADVVPMLNQQETINKMLKRSSTATQDGGEAALAVQGRFKSGGDRLCFNCQKPGHIAKKCPLQHQQRNQGFSQQGGAGCSQQGGESSRPRVCYRCQKQGHLARDCRAVAPVQRPPKEVNNGGGNHQQGNLAEEVRPAQSPLIFQTGYTADHCMVARSTDCTWWVDSGSSSHISFQRELFSTYTEINPIMVRVADSTSHKAVGKGDVRLVLEVKGGFVGATLHEVLHVPTFKTNLFSVSKTLEQGYEVRFKGKKCILLAPDGQVAAEGQVDKGLIWLACRPPRQEEIAAAVTVGSEDDKLLELWHLRMGHLHEAALKKMAKEKLLEGLPEQFRGQLKACAGCRAGKQSRDPFPTRGPAHRGKDLLDMVHTDLCGPMRHLSLSGKKYFMTFQDDYSKKVWVYFLKEKSEAFQWFQVFKAEAENQSEKHIKVLRSDSSGEYTSNEFKAFLRQHGIKQELTAAYTPQQNGGAERLNRTLVGMASSMIHHSSLPLKFWAEAMCCASYIRNRCYSSSLSGKTPEEDWTGFRPSSAGLKAWGCKAFVHVPAQLRGKLEPKAAECILVGYDDVHMGCWRLWDPIRKKISVSRDVRFDEPSSSQVERQRGLSEAGSMELLVELPPAILGAVGASEPQAVGADDEQEDEADGDLEGVHQQPQTIPSLSEEGSAIRRAPTPQPAVGVQEDNISGGGASSSSSLEPLEEVRRYPQRKRRTLKDLDEHVALAMEEHAFVATAREPWTYKEAMASS